MALERNDKRRKSRLYLGWIAAVIVLGALAGSVAWNRTNDNFHAVQEGQCYRSAQPSPADLARYAKQYHIRSVVNLRGAAPGKRWYEREIRACRELGLEHYDVRLPVDAEPSPKTIGRLLQFLRTAPRPILIHCRRGADRSGVAAAIWKIVIEDASREEAQAQLSIRFGHVPLFGRQELDRFVKEWEPEQPAEVAQVAGEDRPRSEVPSAGRGEPQGP